MTFVLFLKPTCAYDPLVQIDNECIKVNEFRLAGFSEYDHLCMYDGNVKHTVPPEELVKRER
jgi:hypothetical protein